MFNIGEIYRKPTYVRGQQVFQPFWVPLLGNERKSKITPLKLFGLSQAFSLLT